MPANRPDGVNVAPKAMRELRMDVSYPYTVTLNAVIATFGIEETPRMRMSIGSVAPCCWNCTPVCIPASTSSSSGSKFAATDCDVVTDGRHVSVALSAIGVYALWRSVNVPYASTPTAAELALLNEMIFVTSTHAGEVNVLLAKSVYTIGPDCPLGACASEMDVTTVVVELT